MITDPKVRRRRILKLIDNHGGGTRLTNAPKKLSSDVRDALLSHVSMSQLEDCLLACYLDIEHWCLVLSDRLLWQRGETQRQLRWSEVRGAEMPQRNWDEVIQNEKRKDSVEELIVVDQEGARYPLQLEKGEGYFLIWSAIIALGALPAV